MKKKVLVTGATRGIGKAIAKVLLKDDYEVYGTGTKKSKIRGAEIKELSKVIWLDVDMSDVSSVRSFTDQLDQIGPFYGLVNNAGVNRIKPLKMVEDDDFDYVHNINLRAPYILCRQLIKGMLELGQGRIVNIASIWSVITKSERSLYTSAKNGLVGLTKALAVEFASNDILINAVSPGFVLTDLTFQSLDENQIRELSNQIPAKRMAEPVDIAEVVSFMISSNNRYITGQNIVVDGGFSIV